MKHKKTFLQSCIVAAILASSQQVIAAPTKTLGVALPNLTNPYFVRNEEELRGERQGARL